MLNLKKTAVAVLALGSSAVFAGTMGPVCAPGNVTVPCERNAWAVGGQALYVQPVYAVEGNYPTVLVNGLTTPLATYNSPSLDWQWGFMIEGAYYFGMGNDINVNWYRVHNTQTSGNTIITTTNLGPTTGGALYSNSLSIEPEWDQVDVEFGQHVDLGEMKHVRLHAGVEYARISTELTTQANFIALNETAQSLFNGFGPRGGVDGAYELGNGFSVYAKGAGSLLVGPGSFNNNINHNNLTPGSSSASYSRTILVPELEGKLGFAYDYAMAQGDLTLDVGWLWINYFNAQLNGMNGSNAFSPAPPAGAGTNVEPVRGLVSFNDFGLQGLYFGGKWTGNV